MFKLLKSTYGQLTLMFGLLLLFNFAILIMSLRQFTIKPTANQLAMQFHNQIISIKPLIQDKEFEQAENILKNTFKDSEISVSLNPIAHKLPSLTFYQAFEKKLMSKSPKQILINESNTESTIYIKPAWISDYWIKMTFQPFIHKVSNFILVLVIASMIMSLMAAYFFSRYMLKPLKQLAKMANDIANDKHIKDIHIGGTSEVQEIGQMVKNSAIQVQQTNQEKEFFLAGVSHDLRTPLARMRIQSEFLKDDESRNDFVQEIEEMDNIINDFVSYVRLGTTENFESIELVQLIKETINSYNENSGNIQWQSEVECLHMSLKPISIKRMLNNIYDNAHKYGKPPVVTTLKQTNNRIRLRIRDHGKGITYDEISNIFNPFYMAQTSDNQYGSGLGLSIVKKLADQNKAKVNAYNHEKGGLVICIEWPTINHGFE